MIFVLAGALTKSQNGQTRTRGAITINLKETQENENQARCGAACGGAINGSYSWVQASFANVSRLTITRDKGWFVMDDLSMSAIGPVPSPVPEPGGMVLLAAGLLMTGFAAKRRKS